MRSSDDAGSAASASWVLRLVVVTVIVVGLLYGCNRLVRPVIAKYRQYDMTAKCAANVQYLVRSCSIYAEDYDGRFPLASAWMDRIGPYTKPAWLKCPAEASKPGAYGYALNEALGGKDRDTLSHPAKWAMIYDSRLLQRSAVDHANTQPNPGRHLTRAQGGSSIRGDVACYANGSGRFVPDGAPFP